MSVDYYALAGSIYTRVNSEIETGLGYTLRYPNDGREQPSTSDMWVRASVQFGSSNQADLGGSLTRFRTLGVLFFQVFTPLGEGTKAGIEAATAIAAKFRKATYSNVVYRTPSVEEIGKSGAFYQFNVNCPFYHDDTE